MSKILTKDKLISIFSEGCKPKKFWRIGTEHEKFGFRKSDLKPIDFNDIESIFLMLSKKYLWEKKYEGKKLIGLKKNKSSITLEPGGQIELSGAPMKNLFETCKEVNIHQNELNDVCRNIGIDFMGMGVLPKWGLNDIPVVPKDRYKIMRSYMPKVGTMGLDMMMRTSTIQANFDYSSEKDMIKKLRVCMSIQPAIIALYANSPFIDGEITKYQSYRSYIWTKTDNSRCGFLPFVYDESFSFERYVDYLLDVPMYFIIRKKKYIDLSGHSFKKFLQGRIKKISNEIPNIEDWNNHITTAFPEVRLKSYIEVRGADGGPWSRVCALPAFWTGILYDESTLEQVWDSIKHWNVNEIKKFYDDVRLKGLMAFTPDGVVLKKYLTGLLETSGKGLEKRNFTYEKKNERYFLEPLFKILESGQSPAETWKKLFLGDWNKNIDNIYRANYFKILQDNEKK